MSCRSVGGSVLGVSLFHRRLSGESATLSQGGILPGARGSSRLGLGGKNDPENEGDLSNVEHENEYDDSMVALLEPVWGKGFMAPGGEGHVAKMVDGLELRGRRVLDIGCGLGAPASILAARHGAHVVGTDLEAPLIECARRRVVEMGVDDEVDFEVVPLDRSGSRTNPSTSS